MVVFLFFLFVDIVNCAVNLTDLLLQEKVSLSEGSTVDMRRPGEEEEDLSELDDDGMEPEDCFPERE